MSTSRERRILKELSDINNDKNQSGVFAQPVDPSNLSHLKGSFPGPPDTPYAGGTYHLDIQIPDNYPFKSPVMRFDTKIWHPNVSSQTVSPPLPVTQAMPLQTCPTRLPCPAHMVSLDGCAILRSIPSMSPRTLPRAKWLIICLFILTVPGSNMSRYPRKRLVPDRHDQLNVDLHTHATRVTEPQGSPRRTSRRADDGRSRAFCRGCS